MVNELRKDYFLDKYVIIAKDRSKRPTDFIHNTKDIKEGSCFFCPGSEDKTPPEIMRKPGAGDWSIRVFPNKFPAVEPKKQGEDKGITELIQPAYGHHEIVVETPRHGESICDLGVDQMTEVLGVFIERINALKQKQDVKYVSVFKNHGKTAGASLSHSHTQIITTPITPPLVEEKIVGQKRYMNKQGVCGYCDILKREGQNSRLVYEDDHSIAFCPIASRFPFETWVMPKKHTPNLESLNEIQINSQAKILTQITRVFKNTLNDIDYNLLLFYGPKEELHVHWEIIPRASLWAGFEYSTNIIINSLPPEKAAQHLRASI